MKQIRIAIAGLGTVGASVFKNLESKAAFKIVAVSAKNKSKDRGLDLNGVIWVDNPIDLAIRDDIDVIVEVMGGDADPAYSLIKKSLQQKKSVVTANKALLAKHGLELARMAEENNVGLYFEAAVAGGIPIIKMLREGLSANNISAVYGILNGTCNYILTTMEQTGQSFNAVLDEAQKLGYAEADPSLDVDGGDTAHKLSILTTLAFGCVPDLKSLSVTGIRSVTAEDIRVANELGYRIKLMGQARQLADGQILNMVSPSLVPKSSFMAYVNGVLNAVLTEGDLVGQSFVAGRGAGGNPTASAVIADLIDISRDVKITPFAKDTNELTTASKVGFSNWQGKFYMRLVVRDEASFTADISPIFRDHHILIESLIQKGLSSESPLNIIIMTDDTNGEDILDAMNKIANLKYVLEKPFVMPVLKI